MTGLLSALAGGGMIAAFTFVAGVNIGIRRGKLLEQNDALAKRNARMRAMVRDIFAEPPHPVSFHPHPLLHPTFRASSFEDVIRKAGE